MIKPQRDSSCGFTIDNTAVGSAVYTLSVSSLPKIFWGKTKGKYYLFQILNVHLIKSLLATLLSPAGKVNHEQYDCRDIVGKEKSDT
jgi:hypothetical protein